MRKLKENKLKFYMPYANITHYINFNRCSPEEVEMLNKAKQVTIDWIIQGKLELANKTDEENKQRVFDLIKRELEQTELGRTARENKEKLKIY